LPLDDYFAEFNDAEDIAADDESTDDDDSEGATSDDDEDDDNDDDNENNNNEDNNNDGGDAVLRDEGVNDDVDVGHQDLQRVGATDHAAIELQGVDENGLPPERKGYRLRNPANTDYNNIGANAPHLKTVCYNAPMPAQAC